MTTHPIFRQLIFTILLAIISSGLVLRFTRLSSTPPGFFVDESSIAYNALTIARTGHDQHGVPFPVFFKAFGEYKNPLYIYSQAFLFTFLSPTVTTSRATAALWGLGTALLFALAIKTLTNSTSTAFFSFALILTSPWHLVLSKVSFEVISYPFFLAASFLVLQRTRTTKSLRLLFLLAFIFALSFYTYTSARLLSPLLFITALLTLRSIFSFKLHLLALVIFAATLIPALIWELAYPGSLSARYQIVSVFNYHPPLQALGHVVTGYLSHFSSRFLFLQADGNLRHTLTWHSVLPWSTAPLLLYGLYSLFAKPSAPHHRWLIFGLLISPLPASLTIQTPHALRSVSLLFFLLVIISYGYHHLSASRHRSLSLVILFFFLIENLTLFRYFLTTYPDRARLWFETDTLDLVTQTISAPQPHYLSTKLYPGSDATWLFVHAASQGTLPPAQPVAYNPDPIDPPNLSPGTYLLDHSTCQLLRQLHPNLQLVSTPTNCALTIYDQNQTP